MSDDNCQIFICHLPKDITENELEEEFEEFGSIKKIEIKNKFAFIEYKKSKSAQKAILEMDGNILFGNRIIVQSAFKGERKNDRKNSEHSSYSENHHNYNNRRKYDNDVCFNCGKSGHWVKDCPERNYKKLLNKRCYYCDKKGHLERDCPLKKNCNSYRASLYKEKRYSESSNSYSLSSHYSKNRKSRSRSKSRSVSSYSSRSYSSRSSYSNSSSYSSKSSSKNNNYKKNKMK